MWTVTCSPRASRVRKLKSAPALELAEFGDRDGGQALEAERAVGFLKEAGGEAHYHVVAHGIPPRFMPASYRAVRAGGERWPK
jgi:hypothetical protein